MNCRAGDLAIVICGPYAGVLVDVLYAAPIGQSFYLPNGVLNCAGSSGDWVVNAMGSPLPVTNTWGRSYLTRTGVTNDTNLRPMRGGEKTDAECYDESFPVPSAVMTEQ